MQQPEHPKLTADQWEALASSWARHGMPMGRVNTARRCVEAGIRLLMLKEITPHGEFRDRVNMLGVEASAAPRYMAVARRFRGAPDAFFEAVGSAAKLIELLPLDEAEALAQGKPAHGLTLEGGVQMTVRELRAAVRAVVAKEREEHRALNDVGAATANAAMRKPIASRVVTALPSPKRSDRGVHLKVEEERMLRRYRKCNAEGRAALLQVAGLLAQT